MEALNPEITALGGFVLGLIAAGASATLSARRREHAIQNHLDTLANQSQTIANYIANWVHAVGEGLSRKELFEELIQAIQSTTSATTVCVFEH